MADTRETKLSRALLIVSSLLQETVKRSETFSETDRWTIRHDGKVIAECTIDEALDMADEALEPHEPSLILNRAPAPEREWPTNSSFA